MKNKVLTLFALTFFVLAFFATTVNAELILDDIQFNPAIVSAGDTVDVVVQFHYVASELDSDRVGNPQYDYKVELDSDSSLVDQYITILDKEGDGYKKIYGDSYYNQVFRIKISDAAPTGDYQFQIFGQWFKNGVSQGAKVGLKFMMPVKREGISINMASINTEPAEVRSGNDFVRINSFIENSGDKNAKDVEVNLILPEGFSSSYSNNNRVWAGNVPSQESKPAVFYVNIDDTLSGGVYNFIYRYTYKDLESNIYSGEKIIPFYVKSRPYIEVISVEGNARKGSSAKLYVTIKNLGNETAESVDVRVLKQSSQPFNFDARSDYVGELAPGEEGVAIFNIEVDNNAEIKEHDLKLIIRAKGDSDDGDDNIYTFTRRAKFEVSKKLVNPFIVVGVLGLILTLIYFKKKDIVKSKIRGRRK